jgi:hypothetical protein
MPTSATSRVHTLCCCAAVQALAGYFVLLLLEGIALAASVSCTALQLGLLPCLCRMNVMAISIRAAVVMRHTVMHACHLTHWCLGYMCSICKACPCTTALMQIPSACCHTLLPH